MGSTNSKISSNNKVVKKQYEYDKKMYDWQNTQNQNAYEHAKDVRELNQAQAKKLADYQDKTANDAWQYQTDLKKQQYEVDAEAYTQSLKDYDKQTELNSMAKAVSKEAENRKFEEALIDANFSKRDAQLNRDKEYSSLDLRKNEASRQLSTAKIDKQLNMDAARIQNQLSKGQYKTDKASIANDLSFARGQKNLAKAQYRQESKFLDRLTGKSQEATKLKNQQIGKDIGFAQRERQIADQRTRIEDKSLEKQKEFNTEQKRIADARVDVSDNQLGADRGFNTERQRIADEKTTISDTFLDARIEDDKALNQQEYDQNQANNMYERMEQMVARNRALGQARAAGREGRSADQSQQSILAEYGRQQAQQVDSLVFAKKKKDTTDDMLDDAYTRDKALNVNQRSSNQLGFDVEGQRISTQSSLNNIQRDDNQLAYNRDNNRIKTALRMNVQQRKSNRLQKEKTVSSLRTQKALNKNAQQQTNIRAQQQQRALDRNLAGANLSFTKSKADAQVRTDQANLKRKGDQASFQNQKSKLEAALADAKQRIDNERQKIADDMGFTKDQFGLSKDKIAATKSSARNAKKAAMTKLNLDEYAANLAAQGNIRSKPKYPVALPVPNKVPVTKIPPINPPKKPPKPMKGTLQKTSVWNDVGDVLNVGLSIAGALTPFAG